MIEINTKVKPLVEDLGRIISGGFLTSTHFKRWLVESQLDVFWDQCIKTVKSNQKVFVFGINHDEYDSKDAFELMISVMYERYFNNLPSVIYNILCLYATEKLERVDTSEIKKDLLAAGYTKEDVGIFDDIPLTETIEEKVKKEETQEQKVRSLEHAYLSMSDVNSHACIDAYLEWHSATLLYLSTYYSDSNPDFNAFKHLDNSGNGYTLRTNFKSINSIYNLLMEGVKKQEGHITLENDKKTPLVFISHSSKDESFVVALVNLLEDMGFNKTNLFCSSVREYGIPLGGDIFGTIRELFLKHELYVIFVHSPRFYGSAVSLNEMGAAWVLKTNFCSFLTKDMSFDKMKGVVNNATISIKVDDKDAPALLNELHKQLSSIFTLSQMDINKWERKRDQFLSIVKAIENHNEEDPAKENEVDNEYKRLQIEKMKAEADARKKAIIRGNIIKGEKGLRELKIFNAGHVIARNVRVEWLNENENVLIPNRFSDIGDLTPQNSRSYTIHLTIRHPETMNLRYTWDDDFAVGNTINESLQL